MLSRRPENQLLRPYCEATPSSCQGGHWVAECNLCKLIAASAPTAGQAGEQVLRHIARGDCRQATRSERKEACRQLQDRR